MKSRNYFVILTVAAFWCSLAAAPGVFSANAVKKNGAKKAAPHKAGLLDQNRFNLKPDARQKACLSCHTGFEELMKKKFIHTPLKRPGCTACHNPHTSNYDKQLPAEVNKLCFGCHKGIMPKNARSTHRVVLEGKCVLCHDPHAADNKGNLRKAGNELCYGCHKEKMDEIKKVKFKHAPVEQACLDCHNPHTSMEAAALLKSDPPALCKGCHDANSSIFVKQHANYPVANSKCTKCHNVHGSERPGIIYDTVHKPFVSKMCNQCHENANSPNPLALRKKGFELCRGCHNDLVNDIFAKNRLHWPVVGKDGCLNCHSPHASTTPGLLIAKPIALCGKCHADTIQREERSVTKHQPVKDGMCTSCHSPHSSNNKFLTLQASTVDFCGTCHDYMKHSTHPVGEKITDKRNKNLHVDCLSCHRSHGTEFKKMIPFGPAVSELCTQCHVEYQR